MIPIADDNSARSRTPWVTYALIAVNVAVFVRQATLDPAGQLALMARFAAVPHWILTDPGAHWWTLVTCTFLHASWVHLGGNMLFLWVFGDNVEDAMGRARYLSFYVVAGLVGSVAQVAVSAHQTIALVGASGAIAGVLAAYLVLFPHGMVRTIVVLVPPIFIWPLLPAWLMIGVWFLLQFWSGLNSLGALDAGGVAYFAHVGGFLAGLVMARRFTSRTRLDARVRDTERYHHPGAPSRWTR